MKGGLEKRVLIRVLPAEPATLSVTWTNDKQVQGNWGIFLIVVTCSNLDGDLED